MSSLQRIAVLNSELEAERLDTELEGKGIPHLMVSYHESAFDGLFQMGRGWGHVEAEPQHREEILALLEALRQVSAQTQGAGAVSAAEPAQAEEKRRVRAAESSNEELLESIRGLAQTVRRSAAAAVCLGAAILFYLILRFGAPHSAAVPPRQWTWSAVRDAMEAGDFETAIQAGNWLARRNQEDAYGHAVLASAYAGVGDVTNALRQAERACALLPTTDNENLLAALRKRFNAPRRAE